MTTVTRDFPQFKPMPTHASVYAKDFSFTVINSHTAAVSTLHEQGVGSPTATRTTREGDIVAPRETFSFSVPIGWSGRLAVYEEGFDIGGRGTLLEGSHFLGANHTPSMALDVSYVDAFTVPMVCECNNIVAFGCNLNLNDVCPKHLQGNAKTCFNPYRDQPGKPGPNNIFRDCETMAYTYPTDDLATKVDIPGCHDSVTCCIGTACKHHPGQKKCPAKDGHVRPCAGL
ncbi:Osmotin, thaumatin-like protein [Hypomontagnella monticulosa]|nr:Osmotin, thaumatin-like protein [Hypomontagnella monticulosa]